MTVTQETQQEYPRTWMWEDDGDTCAGTFVRFDGGQTRGYGRKPIAVLSIEGEERSVWLFATALYNQFRDELADRPDRTLAVGERVVIRRGEKRKTEDGSREYQEFKVLFPDRPEPTTSDLFGLDAEPAASAAETDGKPDGNGNAVDDSIPF